MNILINASNLKQGGGIQVTQSLCGQLSHFRQHTFIVVLSSSFDDSLMEFDNNTKVIRYDILNSFYTLVLGRDAFLDSLVKNEEVDVVLSVFGPSRWRPRVPHLCGFARAQLVLKDSPYYLRRTFKEKLVYPLWTWGFKRSSKVFYTENEYISKMLPELLGESIKTYTVTNYYNQVFDHPEQWSRSRTLPKFDGVTCLSVSNHYAHKNFEILKDVVSFLRREYPSFNVRFVLTFSEKEMPIPDELRNVFLFIGKVGVEECPYLYEQADIMFMPTLMECFTATYPEAMRMGVPIVTTDLEFACGLCGDAACYYSAVDAKACAEAIYKVATDEAYRSRLIERGKEQLKKYDNYEERATKLVEILETIVGS